VTVCPVCGTTQTNPVNVKRAKLKQEIAALDSRYQVSMNSFTARGLQNEHQRLEQLVQTKGKAVINTSFDFTWEWLGPNRSAYTSYRRQLMDKTRQTALFENDVNRTLADSFLYGSATDIIYGALTVNEKGLTSYGEVSVFLKEISVERRTSVLETNSFYFIKDLVDNNQYTFGKPFPAGYLSSWQDKYKLAVSKLASSLNKNISDEELCDLILFSSGDKNTDRFFELHIYGSIVAAAIEKIVIPENVLHSKDIKRQLQWGELRKYYNTEEVQ